jgi:hypothetical protein
MENVKMKEQNPPQRIGSAPRTFIIKHSPLFIQGREEQMDDNKQRWLERQQQQHEENVFLRYQVERSTYFSDYIAVVIVDHKGRTTISLYEGEPETKAAWGLLTIQHDPVSVRKIGRLTNVDHTIKAMIIDHEIPLYQQYMVEEADNHLDINYKEELGKKRQRLASADAEPEAEEVTIHVKPDVHVWNEEKEMTEDEKREQQLLETARKTGKDPNSLRNLVQFKEEKAQ